MMANKSAAYSSTSEVLDVGWLMGAVGSVFGLNALANSGPSYLFRPFEEVNDAPVYKTHPVISIVSVCCSCIVVIAVALLTSFGFLLLVDSIF